MCDATPQVLSAQVFAADGVTPAPGKGPLVAGSDFTLSYAGAPTCALTLAMLTPAAVIGPDQRLIITYRSQLDVDSQDGATLTNVAGATEWFDGDSGTPSRVTFTRTLTDGTPGVLDHQDAHTVTVRRPAYLFEKTVMDVTTGADPATTASPGDRLRYRLRFVNQSTATLSNLSIFDELDARNTPAAFQPGTLALVTVPAGADASNTSATGGAKGTGVVDVRNITAAPGATVLLEFEITLASAIANGALVTNQSALRINGAPFAISDDPNVNGAADPTVAGDEDPTVVRIASPPQLRVQKISTDMTGDPNVLLPGDTLRYTITVKNVGGTDVTDAVFRDSVPANTHYVANSTTLNGTAVADGPGGSSPLSTGIPIYAPGDPTPGHLRADASPTANNVATIVFAVAIDAGVFDGTVISNQGFVGASNVVPEQPSDDPDTAIPDDPTRDVVGNVPLLFAPKVVAIAVDAGTPGVVDPGDVLRYTITVYNTGAVPATNAVFRDAVPANTTYVANSTTLNGLAVGQPDGGVSPLVAGIPISSSDLTPPLPGPGAGILSVGQNAVIVFQVQVNAGVPAGTLISNQGLVDTAELPDLLTDGDSNPATGPEPTVVVVGNAQQLTITKLVSVVGGGPALAGSPLEYVVRVTNIAAVPASRRRDPGRSRGRHAGHAHLRRGVGDSERPRDRRHRRGLAHHGRLLHHLRSAAARRLRRPALPGHDQPRARDGHASHEHGRGLLEQPAADRERQRLDRRGRHAGGRRPERRGLARRRLRQAAGRQRASAAGLDRRRCTGTAAAAVGRHGRGGHLQHRRRRAEHRRRRSLRAALPSSGRGAEHGVARHRRLPVHERSAADQRHRGGVGEQPPEPQPADHPERRRLRRHRSRADPRRGAPPALRERRDPRALRAASTTRVQQGQVTRGDGYYKFDLNFSDAACPSGGSYLIEIVAPGATFTAGYSQLIPPTSDASTAAALGPHLSGQRRRRGAGHARLLRGPGLRVRAAAFRAGAHAGHELLRAPDSRLEPRPGHEPDLQQPHSAGPGARAARLGITKTTPSINVSRGQLVPYEIVLSNKFGSTLSGHQHRRPLPRGLPLRRGIRADRRRAGRADGQRRAARLDRTSTCRSRASGPCSSCSRSAPASPRASS